jgi:hypothetical protein
MLPQLVVVPVILDFTMDFNKKVKVSYGEGNRRNKGIQLPLISTQSYSDIPYLRKNILHQMLKHKSFEDLGGNSNTKV